MHVSRIAFVTQILVSLHLSLVPLNQLLSLHSSTQISNLKVKEPSLILMLSLSQAICRFHGSPFLCSNLPTPCQLLCLGDGSSPSVASDSHFSPVLPCSCKVHLFLFIPLPKAIPMIHMLCASGPCSSHPVHCLLHHHCCPTALWFPCPRAFAPASLPPSPLSHPMASCFQSLMGSFLIVLV